MTDSPAAEPAAPESWSRRLAIGAGVLGAVLVASGGSPAAAGSRQLSDEDLANANFAIGVELAARDLYRAAITAGAKGTAWEIFANQHASYAQRIAGITGTSANTPDRAVFDAREAAFSGDRPANAAYDLENTLVATNAALLGQISDTNISNALASIVAMEARQAAYLAERSGRGDNFDALFTNTGTPLVRAVTP